jgi:hypothetical protein
MDHHHSFGQMCVCGCRRPARELGGYSTACWMGLTPMQRKMLQEDGDRERGDTIAFDRIFDPVAAEIAALPTYLGPRRFAV